MKDFEGICFGATFQAGLICNTFKSSGQIPV